MRKGFSKPASKKKIAEFLGSTYQTVGNWEKENRYIIQFIRKYLNSDTFLDEFMETGKIKKLETKTLDDQFKQLLLEDHMLHNAAHKLHLPSSSTYKMVEILEDALSDIDPNDDTYTLDNAKQRLIDRIFSTKAKEEGVATWIDRYMSKAEVFAMVKNPTAFIKLLK